MTAYAIGLAVASFVICVRIRCICQSLSETTGNILNGTLESVCDGSKFFRENASVGLGMGASVLSNRGFGRFRRKI